MYGKSIAYVLVTGGLLSIVLAGAVAGEEPLQKVTHDGLHLVPGAKVAAAWAKPDADFSGYDKIMILDAYVAFKKNWARDHNRTSVYRITPRDVENIKQGTAELLRETFVEELSRDGGYPVVDAAGADVLLLRPAIIDLDVTAPDVPHAGRTYNFASSAGAATLLLELYDSVSGEILARAIDRKTARHPGHLMRWSNKATNRAEARKVLSGWARQLRVRLDEIHGKQEQ